MQLLWTSDVRGVATVLFVLVTALASPVAGGAQSDPKAHSKLQGAWVLNTDRSEDVEAALEAAQGSRSGEREGRFPGGAAGRMGGRGGGRGAGVGRDPELIRQMRQSMTSALEAPARLTITQRGDELIFVDGDGHSLTIATNNKKRKFPFDGGEIEVRAKWDNAALVRETTYASGMKVIETFAVSPDRQLTVTAKLEGSRVPSAVTVRRVYDELLAR